VAPDVAWHVSANKCSKYQVVLNFCGSILLGKYIDHQTVQLVTPRLQNQSYTLLLCQRTCTCTELLCCVTL
jgi:hypothetical protein